MEHSLIAMAFAENLMRFVIEKNEMTWIPRHDAQVYGKMINTDLIVTVGTAVCNLICKAKSCINACKEELVEMQCVDNAQFSRYALAAARFYFRPGYKPRLFLTYCAMVGGVGSMLYTTNKDIPQCSAEVIAIVLTAHILTRKFSETGGYSSLTDMCLRFNGGIEMQKSRDEQISGDEKSS